MNRLIKAYTVIELIVVMLISGITITIAYRGFDIFQNLFMSFKKTGTEISSMAFFDRVLSEDMSSATHVYLNESGVNCLYEGKEMRKYAFGDGIIIRQTARNDTFFIDPSEVRYYLFKEEQLEEGSLIDRIAISSYSKEDSLFFDFHKTYGADVLMEYNREKE